MRFIRKYEFASPNGAPALRHSEAARDEALDFLFLFFSKIHFSSPTFSASDRSETGIYTRRRGGIM